MVDREPQKINRREFLRLSGGALAGLVAGAAVDKFGGKRVEAAPLTEALPERISWEEYLPYEPSFSSNGCAPLTGAELMRTWMNRLNNGGFYRGTINQSSTDPHSDEVFNPNFIGIGGMSLYQVGDCLKNYGVCRNHLFPNSTEMGDGVPFPTDEQKEDALRYRPKDFKSNLYSPVNIREINIIDELKKELVKGPIGLGYPVYPGYHETMDGIVRRIPSGQDYFDSHANVLFAIDDNFDTRDGDRGALGLWWSLGIFDSAIAWMPYKYITEDVASVTDPQAALTANIVTLSLTFEEELSHKTYLPHVSRGR